MALQISVYASFEKQCVRKPRMLQEKVWKQVEMLRDDPTYPSLRVKKIRGTKLGKVWEASIDMTHRITFEYSADGTSIILRNCNGHEVLRQP